MPDLFYTVDSYLPNGMSQRVVMIDTPQLVGVFSGGKNQTPEGDPPNREYADKMWQWIDDILAESGDFNYLFVAGHYQVKLRVTPFLNNCL